MAEREGFEPSVELPLHSISNAAPSTTRPPLRFNGIQRNSKEFNGIQRQKYSLNYGISKFGSGIFFTSFRNQ